MKFKSVKIKVTHWSYRVPVLKMTSKNFIFVKFEFNLQVKAN